MSKEQLVFTNFQDVKKLIQNELDILFVVGHGTTYIHPTRTTLEAISFAGKNEKFKKVKVFLIDEEIHRTKDVVVGCGFLILYYNGKPIQLKFTSSGQTSTTNAYTGQLTREKVDYIITTTLAKIRSTKIATDLTVDLNLEQISKSQESNKEDGTENVNSEDDTSSGEDTGDETEEMYQETPEGPQNLISAPSFSKQKMNLSFVIKK